MSRLILSLLRVGGVVAVTTTEASAVVIALLAFIGRAALRVLSLSPRRSFSPRVPSWPQEPS
jgi:hypothetical protein